MDRPDDDPDPPRLTVADAARLTGLCENTVRALADAGVIRCLRVVVPGRTSATRRFRRSWVKEFVESHTTPAPAGG